MNCSYCDLIAAVEPSYAARPAECDVCVLSH